MKRIHPNVSCTATCAAIAFVLGMCGCKSSSSGIAGSPFLSPDRVPPPSTRAILPGQAQPYYPGDPLPVMQSATQPPASAVVANPNTSDARSSTGKTLAWNVPGGAAPSNASVPAPVTPIAYAKEPVAVPTDADPLRFALPAPAEPQPITPIEATPMPTSSQPIQTTMAPTNQAVQLASYTAPIVTSPAPPSTASLINPPPQIYSPWRSPQIATTTPLPIYGRQQSPLQPGAQPIVLPSAPTYSMAPPQNALAMNSMPVQLRAVPSPEPGDPMPRVRVPGYATPPTATADGFRPRSTMR